MKTRIASRLYQEIALRHGVDLKQVTPQSQEVRLQQLLAALQNREVPYPVDPKIADQYYRLAAFRVPFGIGTLTDQTVQLGEYTNQQVYESLTFEDHLSWACLVADQQSTKHQYACQEYLMGEQMFEIGGARIPDYYLLNARIYQQTGWQLATVNKIIPANVFFHCHSRRFFPVTTFMRPLETDYLQEPDIGHDVAGHVATFTIPQVAQVMNNHGLANDLIHREKEARLRSAKTAAQRAAILAEAEELLLYAGRLYWFTVEFGLVREQGKLKAFGAGILSSPGETQHSVDSPLSNRILVDVTRDRDLLRLATTDYLISEYQKTYFVLDQFDSLNSLTPDRIMHIVHTARHLPHHTWTEIVPGDQVIHVGQVMASANEKYARWRAGLPLDACQIRTVHRNLPMFAAGIQPENSLGEEFMRDLPAPPQI